MHDQQYGSCLEDVLIALKNNRLSFTLKGEEESALRHLNSST